MELKTFDSEKFNAIKESWLSYLLPDSHAVYRAEYTQLFDMIQEGSSFGELDARYNTPIHQSIEHNDKVWAIVSIVQSKSGSSTWVKLMDIYMSPEIDIAPDSEGNTEKRLEVFVAALLGILSLTKDVKRADTFKVFGRTDALVAFLRGMHDVFSTITTIGTIKGVNVAIEGRWLVFRATTTD